MKIEIETYNHLNLPLKVTFGTTGNIAYTYDAMGVKFKKVVTQGSTVTTTYYLSGFQYTQNGTGTVELQFFPTAEGYVRYIVMNTGGKRIYYQYIYNYTDHLGNIRLSYSKDPTTNETVVVEEQHYYPFGLEHPYNKIEKDLITTWNLTETFGQVTENKYQYQYNGKEWQDELGLNMYDMDMRQYDPAIARWVVQDPTVHHGMSPYNAFDNNPVFWADPSGADGVGADGLTMEQWLNARGNSEREDYYRKNNRKERQENATDNCDKCKDPNILIAALARAGYDHGELLAKIYIDIYLNPEKHYLQDDKYNMFKLNKPMNVGMKQRHQKNPWYYMITLSDINKYFFTQEFYIQNKEGTTEKITGYAHINIYKDINDMNIYSVKMTEAYNTDKAIEFYNRKGATVASIEIENTEDALKIWKFYFTDIARGRRKEIIDDFKTKNSK